jgi:hypothetical protein
LTSSGQIQVVSKSATSGPSPDHADAAVIALYGVRGGDRYAATLSIPQGQIPRGPQAPRRVRLPAVVSMFPPGTPSWQRQFTRRVRARPAPQQPEEES